MNEKLDNICEECEKKDESVNQNLIKHGYKICDSCFTSKTIFPIQIEFTGIIFILLITNEIDKKTIVRNDKITIPNGKKLKNNGLIIDRNLPTLVAMKESAS